MKMQSKSKNKQNNKLKYIQNTHTNYLLIIFHIKNILVIIYVLLIKSIVIWDSSTHFFTYIHHTWIL